MTTNARTHKKIKTTRISLGTVVRICNRLFNRLSSSPSISKKKPAQKKKMRRPTLRNQSGQKSVIKAGYQTTTSLLQQFTTTTTTIITTAILIPPMDRVRLTDKSYPSRPFYPHSQVPSYLSRTRSSRYSLSALRS